MLTKLKDKLMKLDEVQVMELLDVSVEDLLAAFPEKLQTRRSYITKELEMVNDPYEELNFDD